MNAQLLGTAFGQRQRIVDELDAGDAGGEGRADRPADGSVGDNDDNELEAATKRHLEGPSQAARDQFEDYRGCRSRPSVRIC